MTDRAREEQDHSMNKSHRTLPVKETQYLGVNLTKEVEDSTMKTSNVRRKQLRKISEDGKISYAHRLVELML